VVVVVVVVMMPVMAIVVMMMMTTPIVMVVVPAMATMVPVMVAIVHRIGTRASLLHAHLVGCDRRPGARGRDAEARRDGSGGQKLLQHDDPPDSVSAGMYPAQLALAP
jgi:hypothetical protein